jgi:hypothetical protein
VPRVSVALTERYRSAISRLGHEMRVSSAMCHSMLTPTLIQSTQ